MKKMNLTPQELLEKNEAWGKRMSEFMQSIGGVMSYAGESGPPGSSLKFEINLPKTLPFLGWMPNCAPCTDIVLTEEKDHWLIKGSNNIEPLEQLKAIKGIPADAPLIQTEVIKGFNLIIDTGIDDLLIGPDESGKIEQHPLYRFYQFEVKHLIKM